MLVTAAFGTANTAQDVRYQVLNADRTVHVARTATGVTELVAGSGTYGVQLAPSVIYGRTVVFDIDGTSKVAVATYYDLPDADLVAFLAAYWQRKFDAVDEHPGPGKRTYRLWNAAGTAPESTWVVDKTTGAREPMVHVP